MTSLSLIQPAMGAVLVPGALIYLEDTWEPEKQDVQSEERGHHIPTTVESKSPSPAANDTRQVILV